MAASLVQAAHVDKVFAAVRAVAEPAGKQVKRILPALSIHTLAES